MASASQYARKYRIIPRLTPGEPIKFQLLDIQEGIVKAWRSSDDELKFSSYPVHDQMCTDQFFGPPDGLDAHERPAYDDEKCMLLLFGADEKGQSVCVQVRYVPYVFVQIPDDWQEFHIINFIQALEKKKVNNVKFTQERRHHLSGWQSDVKDPLQRRFNNYLRLRFSSLKHLKTCVFVLREPLPMPGMTTALKFPVHESTQIKPAIKFLDDLGLMAGGWITVNQHLTPENGYCSTCQIEVQAKSLGSIKSVQPEIAAIAPLLVASVDAEMYSKKHKFPCAENKEDVVVGIGLSVARTTNLTDSVGYYFAYLPGSKTVQVHEEKDEDKGDKITIFTYPTEVAMIEGYRDFLVCLDPDVVLGYNTNRFDWKYLAARVNPTSRFFYQSRIALKPTPLEEFKIESAAFGQNVEYHINMFGRIQIDMMTNIKRNVAFRLRDYQLTTVSKHFLKDDKVDLPYVEQFKCFEQGLEGTKKIAIYCVQDTRLPMRLMQVTMALQNIIEMGRVTSTMPQEVVLRGQQAKISNFFFREAHKAGFVFTQFEDTKVPDYAGATVIEPKVGFYDSFVVTLDYSSLYPSILIDNNLSHDTFVDPATTTKLPLDLFRTVDNGATLQDQFVKHVEGMLPKMERQLLTQRKAVKKQMKDEKDATVQAMLDAKQNAIKVRQGS